jgi:hypothetical protein
MNARDVARALLGAANFDTVGDFWQDAAADFVADLLDLAAHELASGDASDRAHECADALVPVYDYQRYELLSDLRTVRAIEDGFDEFGADAFRDRDGRPNFAHLVGVGIYGALRQDFETMLRRFDRPEDRPAAFEALGLDADEAELASALLPEWSGTVRELVEAAPRLVDEWVGR